MSDEILAINHMQRKLSATDTIHGTRLAAPVRTGTDGKPEVVQLLLANNATPQTISGDLTITAQLRLGSSAVALNDVTTGLVRPEVLPVATNSALGTIKLGSTFTTDGGALKLAANANVTGSALVWTGATGDYARLEMANYGADADHLTLTYGVDATDGVLFKSDVAGTLTTTMQLRADGVTLVNAQANQLTFGVSAALPAVDGTRSAGTKLVLAAGQAIDKTDLALGVETGGTGWWSVPDRTGGWKFYAGQPTNPFLAATLDGNGNLSIAGNLNVAGTSTTVSSTTLSVTDRFVTVNSSTGAAPAPSSLTGLAIHRGNDGTADRDQAAFAWDEATSRFQLSWLNGTTDMATSSTVPMGLKVPGLIEAAQPTGLGTPAGAGKVVVTGLDGLLPVAAIPATAITSVGTMDPLTLVVGRTAGQVRFSLGDGAGDFELVYLGGSVQIRGTTPDNGNYYRDGGDIVFFDAPDLGLDLLIGVGRYRTYIPPTVYQRKGELPFATLRVTDALAAAGGAAVDAAYVLGDKIFSKLTAVVLQSPATGNLVVRAHKLAADGTETLLGELTIVGTGGLARTKLDVADVMVLADEVVTLKVVSAVAGFVDARVSLHE